MAVTLPNTGLVVPDEGNTSWYDEFVALMQVLDGLVPTEAQVIAATDLHREAQLRAIINDLYRDVRLLKTTTTGDVVEGADTLVEGGATVIERS